ncbi:MAG: hypothetical protein WBD40_20860 [Tepidisphaeraceae bacterium]
MQFNQPTLASALALAGALAITAHRAVAAPVNFQTPLGWTRPADDAAATATQTTYQAWETFVDADGGTGAAPNSPNNPSVADVNPNGAANTYDTSGGSFLTGGGNIYSPGVATQIRSIIPDYAAGAGFVTTVLAQVKTFGTEPNYGAITLTYHDGTSNVSIAPFSMTELSRTTLGGPFGGGDVERAYVFHVPHSAASLDLFIPASGSSMSLDYVAIDTITTPVEVGYVSAIPEPTAIAPLACGAVALLSRRRRHARRQREEVAVSPLFASRK